jgi:hypothetical protein|tara:strand:+ start:186 stop:764 length:579 start_codon:yes stop_codon:yes gene_type:complete
MIKDGITIKAFYKGKEVKIIQLQHLHFFFRGLSTLSSEWKVEPFKKLWEDCEDDLKYHAMTIFIGLLYKDMCTKRGWEVNYKRFKNEMLLKNKYPKVFLLESDYLTIPDNEFDNAFRLLKKCGFIEQGSHPSYIRLNNSPMGYSRKLGNYLFNTEYAQKSIERNTHYFGDHTSYDHYEAFQERKQVSNKTLN